LVKAQTGSGKTLAYLIPMVQKLQESTQQTNNFKRAEGTQALILAPTRELSLQIFDVLKQILKPFHWIVPGIVIGGEKRKSEKARLRKGVNILIATPGRLLDHLNNTACFKYDNIKWLILDEADRLLDLGFERDIKNIITIIDKAQTTTRQSALISATLREGVKRLATISLNNPIFLDATIDPTVDKDNDNKIEKKKVKI